MQDVQKSARALEQSGKADQLRRLAESDAGREISRMVDAAAVEQAAKSGDQAALRKILTQVLSTDAGRRLAQQLNETMKD